jgi:hypothetical protein
MPLTALSPAADDLVAALGPDVVVATRLIQEAV